MSETLSGVTPVTGKYIKPAALTLARAFQEYPVSVFLEPDAEKRKKDQPVVFRNLIKANQSIWTIYGSSPGMEGVAVWISVDKNKPEPQGRRSLIEWMKSFREDKAKAGRRQAFMDYSEAVRDRILPERYWYLRLLGVAPEHQGRGFASILLKPMLELAEKQGKVCFLETQLLKNVSLYTRFGFTVAEEGNIPGSEVHSWAMIKK